MSFLRNLFATAVLGLGVSIPAAARAPLEPADGRTLLIVGQEKHEIARYWKEVGPAGGYMLYSSLATLSGLDGPIKGSGCSDSGTMDFQDWVQNYPDTVAQVGLYMVSSLTDAATGELDHVIADMAEILRQSGKPVFLRIGYEFDGPWNRYHPDLYKMAWKRIADILHGRQVGEVSIAPVSNVALVWHSGAYDTYMNRPIADWYPGDEYVDWVALSWFQWGSDDNEAAATEAREKVAAFARTHGKPLMIAESAPKQYFEAHDPKAWAGWHQRVLDWISANNVKAYSYINQDWTAMPQWQAACGNGADWGNTRIQKPGSRILETWRKELENPRWLRQGPELYPAIGFTPR
ncbi:glycosyl hydrolase [Niveibacterium sp. SC-1]|uniref:glycosyl hydrolase n=1 Tax=Niveibacterium sp. SC-1 TaxID=3135646 RepID=UPI00311F809E